MFSFIKKAFSDVYAQFSSKLSTLLGRSTLDLETLKELETLLLSADVGVQTTRFIIERLKKETGNKPLHESLRIILHDILIAVKQPESGLRIHLLVGINGSGKTTSAGKLSHYYAQQEKRVLLVAADTFRAAACEQLAVWAAKSSAAFVRGNQGQDPASVVFAGCERFIKEKFDVLIIDTAGRLQTKANLMQELAKLKRVVTRQLPHEKIKTLLTIDAMLGQNSFEQALLFNESTDLDGIILTKTDGTGKGGIIFAVAHTLKVPVLFLSYGERIEQIAHFDPDQYTRELVYNRI